MRNSLLPLLTLASLAGQTAHGATLFEDGFEAGLTQWTITKTGTGRVVASTAHGPATGDYHLVLDDSSSDAVFSVAEASLALDLSAKKDVVLTFKAKSLGNEPHAPPTANFTTTRAYDGVAISADGGLTWRSVQSLATLGSDWTSFTISLDAALAALGGSYGPDFRIRFSGYDNAPVPIDGLAIDDVKVTGSDDRQVLLEFPSPVEEGSGPHTAYAMLSLPSETATTISFAASPSGQLVLPASVSIPAGETFASFEFSVVDDSLVNLTRTVTVSGEAAGNVPIASNVTVVDNDSPTATLTLPPQLTEGQSPSNNATLTLSKTTSVPYTVSLAASPAGELTLPSSVTIPSGQTQVSFTVRANNDSRIDGDIPVTVTASATGLTPASATTTAIDNETRALTLTLPATLSEAASTSGSVTLSGTLAAPLTVNLAGSNPGSLSLPPTVTIPAGQTTATFNAVATDNTDRDGTRNVTVTATANSFTEAAKALLIRDNEVASYAFSALTDIVNLSSPLTVTVSAADVEGNAITGPAGAVDLNLLLPDGSPAAVTPASVSLGSTGTWTGTITLPGNAETSLRLKASDAAGNSGISTPFDTLRALALKTADLIWDQQRDRLYASIPATGGTHANKVLAIDPATLQITGSVTTNQDPGQLAITSGGEFLYVVLNGNGSVAKIDLQPMTVASTFPVGTDTNYGTLYAEDISTVEGQPDLLVASLYRKSVSPRHGGVAVFDKGVRRAKVTRDHTGSNIIEPSADPTIFFGYNTETTEYGFRRLKLDASGMTELEVSGAVFSGFSTEMKSAGDKVFSEAGVAADGSLLKRLGSFGTRGPVRPDLASNRVFYIEQQDSSGYYYSSYTRIAAYDPTTFSPIRRLNLPANLPAPLDAPKSFIRWGTKGLAFRNGDQVYVVASSQLVPHEAPADLEVKVEATPNPASVASPLVYTVSVTNHGPNPAGGTMLGVKLSDSQTLQSTTASIGVPTVSGTTVNLPVGNVAVGQTVTLTLTSLPQSAGSLSCSASASSNALDANFANNTGFKLVSVGFQSGIDVVNQLRLSANNLIYDAGRDLLWASIPGTVEAPLGKTVVSIDPKTGLISQPIPIGANPYPQSIALSGNGRYLYLGLSDVPEVHRIDLSSPSYASTRIALGSSQWGSANYAQDIEALDGSGTSFIMTGSDDHGAAVYDDGTGMRPTRSGIYSMDRIERGPAPGIFLGYNAYTSGFQTSRVTVGASGASIAQQAGNVISGYYVDVKSSGDYLLSGTGKLVNATNLTLRATLGAAGAPCVDAPNQRAYLVSANSVRGYDIVTGAPTAALTLPISSTSSDSVSGCVRWGADGLAILGKDGKIYIARWSATIPPGMDQDGDGIDDQWAAQHFGNIAVSADQDSDGDGLADTLEYLFGTSPVLASSNPLQVGLGGNPAGASLREGSNVGVLKLVFPRRRGVDPSSYKVEIGDTVADWAPAEGVTEQVIATETVDGVTIDLVEASVPMPAGSGRGFARINWKGR